MDKEKIVTVNIINRNYFPNRGITGESAAELAGFLIQKGVRVNVIHIDAEYQTGADRKEPVGCVFPIKTFYNGKNSLLRLLSSVYEGVALVRKSKSVKCDVTICMTEPPLLNVVAALLFRKQQKWILWSMDLFPDALAVGKKLSPSSMAYKWLDRIVQTNKPDHIIALGNCQIEYLKKKYGQGIGFTMLPCGIYSSSSFGRDSKFPAWFNENIKIHFGYCGNLGEAHSVDFLISFIDFIQPSKHKLILSLYGTKAKRVLDYAAGKSGIEIVPFVTRDEMKFIDVHLASLKREWVNICVPSKTISSVCSGSTFLYYGIKESDNWQMLEPAGWIVPTDEGMLNEFLPDLINKEIEKTLAEKRLAARELGLKLQITKQLAFNGIYSEISKLTHRGKTSLVEQELQ